MTTQAAIQAKPLFAFGQTLATRGAMVVMQHAGSIPACLVKPPPTR